MTRLYLVANIIGNGGSNSPREFEPYGLFDNIDKASQFILTLENFHKLAIIVLYSQKYDKNNTEQYNFERSYHIQQVFNEVNIPEVKSEELLYFVTSTSQFDLGKNFHSFFPMFSLNLHGVFDNQNNAQECIDNLGDIQLSASEYSSFPTITQTQYEPIVGKPIAMLAQHFDFNLLTSKFRKPYKLTVKYEHLDVIQTSVLENIYPYLAYTNIDPSIENIDKYAMELLAKNRVQALHNAANLIFTARNWNKTELKKYLFARLDETANLIYLHLIDYPDQKISFDDNRFYSSLQLICNYINKQEKTSPRLDLSSQQEILQMFIDLHPTR